MGQAGSSQLAPAPRRYHHAASGGGGVGIATLPLEPLRLAPKVLPTLDASPRLRCTDNGAILHSGGTISGRRALSAPAPAPAPSVPLAHHAQLARARHNHAGVYRSRSASSGEAPPPPPAADLGGEGSGGGGGRLARERDPLHRSHTHLDLHDHPDSTIPKRFGSEPELRGEEEPTLQQPRTNRHFRKKYKAPPPPPPVHSGATVAARDDSSPDSCDGNNLNGPTRKLRLFKTRTETKKLVGQPEDIQHCRRSQRLQAEPLDIRQESQSLERRYKTTSKEREQFVKYPECREHDMMQSAASLRTEQHLLHAHRHDYKTCQYDKPSVYRSKAQKIQDKETCKTPHLDRTFRYSERFKKEQIDPPVLRRERSFDATLVAKEREKKDLMESIHLSRIKVIGEQLKSSRLAPLSPNDKQLRKSLPSLLVNNIEEKDEFQKELKKATNRIRNDVNVNSNSSGGKAVNEMKPSQNNRYVMNKCSKSNTRETINQLPIQNIKVKDSSPKTCSISVLRQESNASKINSDYQNTERSNKCEAKRLVQKQNELNNPCKRQSRGFADRGQASGKESTPEQSPTRLKERENNMEREKTAPSKQFYFGMIESKEVDMKENVKEFPGLGGPIIEEFSNFHLIEKKLLSYHDQELETEHFATRLHGNRLNNKNVSSESALSSSEEEVGSAGSAESRGIALRLRPTLPKKQLEIPRFSPAAAWRQLAQVEPEPDVQETLEVEVGLPAAVAPPEESPRRSDKSGDKSGDSGISGDHTHSDPRLDSPPRPHVACAEASAWTPQQDLEGDSGSDGAGGGGVCGAGAASDEAEPCAAVRGEGMVTYSVRGQPFSLSLPRDRAPQDKNKPFQQPFNSLQKLRKSVSGALGAALGSRRFDLEHEPPPEEPAEQNWFLSKSAPTSLTHPHPLLHPHHPHHTHQPPHAHARVKGTNEGDIEEEPTPPPSDQEDGGGGVTAWSAGGGSGGGRGASYLSWGGHVMYLPPAPAPAHPATAARAAHAQPLSLLLTTAHPVRPTRSKSSGEIELRSRGARAAGGRGLADEMRERERSASPARQPLGSGCGSLARALPARIVAATPSPSPHTTPPNTRGSRNGGGGAGGGEGGGGGGGGGGGRSRGKRFTFQSTVRQLERRRVAERLSREADLKELQRRTELEAMRRVEEEFQRKRAREKASIRQQLRLVSGTASLPPAQSHTSHHKQARDEPDGAVSPRGSPAPAQVPAPTATTYDKTERRTKERERRDDERDQRHSNASSEISARSKSTTPVRCVELSEWREGGGGGAARQYRDWGAPPGTQPAHNIAHPPACYRMPKSPAPVYLNANGKEAAETFSGSPRSDNYRLEFARGARASPRTPRAPRHPLASHRAPHSPSSSGSELSATATTAARQAIRLREESRCAAPEPAIVPTLQPASSAPPPRRPHLVSSALALR